MNKVFFCCKIVVHDICRVLLYFFFSYWYPNISTYFFPYYIACKNSKLRMFTFWLDDFERKVIMNNRMSAWKIEANIFSRFFFNFFDYIYDRIMCMYMNHVLDAIKRNNFTKKIITIDWKSNYNIFFLWDYDFIWTYWITGECSGWRELWKQTRNMYRCMIWWTDWCI